MAKANSTARVSRRKPESFPLYRHATGQWCKRVKGRLVYFGKDKDAALNRWLDEREYLLAGRRPPSRAQGDAVTLRDAANRYLSHQESRFKNDQVSREHFDDMHKSCGIAIEVLGKNTLVDDLEPDDYGKLYAALNSRYGYSRLKSTVSRIRSMFKWTYENGLVDRPPKYGSQFSAPKKREQRKERALAGRREFTPKQLRQLIDDASVEMKAIILLGINTGIGNKDIALLEFDDIDLAHGYLDSPRKKTYVPRRAALWNETREAIENALKVRRKPRLPIDKDILFVTKYGGPWGSRDTSDSAITKEFRKLLDKTGIYRRGLSYYALRHTYRTVADEVKDQPAVNYTMGHDDGSMASNYRQSIRDERLIAIANHVHSWLYGGEGGAK